MLPSTAFDTSHGGRSPDVWGESARTAYEAKSGYTSYNQRVTLQVLKDAELLTEGTFERGKWHFFRSPVSGRIGPSRPLIDALRNAGMDRYQIKS